MEPFKNMLGFEAAQKIAASLERSYPPFDAKQFLKKLKQELEPLELKARMHCLKQRLHENLPPSPEKSIPLLVDALKKGDHDKLGLSNFLVWPLAQFVADYGQKHFEISMAALHAMTQVFTAEFAIRRFLIENESKTLKTLTKWSQDPSEHVRRLASEGSRPFLPWGEKLVRFAQDPELTWHILENLKNDSSLYVRKSVANHINDHSKTHNDWIVTKLKQWKTDQPQCKNTDWIIRHGTRTLVKKGHKGALALHGIKATSVEVLKVKILSPQVILGGALEVQLTLRNPSSKPALLMIDHELCLLGAHEKYRSKIFKGKKITLQGKSEETLAMRLPIRKVTVRRYYPGTQYWRFILNGVLSEKKPFQLLVTARPQRN